MTVFRNVFVGFVIFFVAFSVQRAFRGEEVSALHNRITSLFASKSSHIVVVGGGLAGLSAAITAAEKGSQVTLLEKSERIGGNSAKATSGINGCGTLAQQSANVVDSQPLFEQDTLESGVSSVPSLVWTLTTKSNEAIQWLSNLGIPLTVLSQLGGHSARRTHRAPDRPDGTPTPIGFTIIQTLEKVIRSQYANLITVVTSATVEELVFDASHQRVSGVRYRTADMSARGAGTISKQVIELVADAVILATGGFSNDHTDNSLLQEFAPHLLGFATTNGPFATGDGVKMARNIGVSLRDMDKIQLHPTAFVSPKDPNSATKFLGPEALRGSGGILLNSRGKRFVNELSLRSIVTAAIDAQGDVFPGSNGVRYAHCVLNDAAVELFGRGALNFYWKRLGLFTKLDTAADLAKHIGCAPEVLESTLHAYELLSSSNAVCPETNKTVFPSVLSSHGPYYVAAVTPAIHYTMGGCEITAATEMIHAASRQPIKGLFGAGEVTSGVHGANRLAGNSLLECVVFGRIAGDRSVTSQRQSITGTGHIKEVEVKILSLDKHRDTIQFALSTPLRSLLKFRVMEVTLNDNDESLSLQLVRSTDEKSSSPLHVVECYLPKDESEKRALIAKASALVRASFH